MQGDKVFARIAYCCKGIARNIDEMSVQAFRLAIQQVTAQSVCLNIPNDYSIVGFGEGFCLG